MEAYGGYPMQFADSTQNHKRMIGTPNQTNQNENFLKKSMFSKNSRANYPTKFAPEA
jgi:hypothetical protein